jgi:single-stranded-DNA-specific exonuclease
MRWTKDEVDPERVKELSRRFGVDLLTAAVLVRRGVTSPEELLYFLESDWRFLHNPFLLGSMMEAVERLGAAVESGETILIFGDRDVDGITATVLMHESLTELGGDVRWMLPEGEDGYGLSPAVIDRAVEMGATLLVTVDCGVSNAAEIEEAARRGIDTVVIDHHNPPAALPAALAIVNPKLPGSHYPFRDLCGCAVASKVDWALRFSRSPFFGEPFVLLNARPANETCIIDAVQLVNLAPAARISEAVVPGILGFERSRLRGFLSAASGAGEILVLDAPAQARLLEKAFGPGLDLPLSDLAPLVREYLPEQAGKSLLKLQQGSRAGRYRDGEPGEIETLADLFVSLVLAREKERLAPALRQMDLVTLGTLADLMPLVNENRILVKQGMEALRRFERRGLRAVFARKDLLGKKFGTTEIAWQVAPFLNSAGRMGQPAKAAELLLSRADEDTDALVEHLFSLDSRRKTMGETTWGLMLDQARTCYERTGGRCVLVWDQRIQRGITGIMASRLQGFFKAPAVVIAAGEESAVGSIRSTRNGVIEGFFERFGPFFTSYGGHDFAGGFSLERGRLESFLESFSARADEMEVPAAGEETIRIDAEIPLAYLTPDLVRLVELFEPYGEGNPPLAFMTKGLKVLNCELIGRKEANHLKLLLDGGKARWPAVFWNGAGRFPADFGIGDTVDLLYRMGKNTYGGGETLQLTVLDIKKG